MQSFIRAQYVRKQKDSLNIGHILKIIQENVFFFAIVFIDLLRNGDMRADRNCGSLLVGLHFQLVFIFLGDFEPVAEIKEHSRSKGYTEQI